MSPVWLPGVAGLLALAVPHVAAQIATVPFTDCSPNDSDSATRINISTIYAQINNSDPRARSLNITLLGQSGSQIFYSSDSSNLLSTVFAPTQALTFTLNPDTQSQFAFCQTLRPPSPLSRSLFNNQSGYCPVPAGPIAFSVSTPLSRSFELTSLNTQIRVLDTSNPAKQLACVNVAVTPLRSGPNFFGQAIIVFWVSVGLAIAYWLVVGAGRLAAAAKRGRQRVHDTLYSRVQAVGFAFASAISGERFASSPALMRFGTPSMRDIIFHTQWCTILGMVTVQWPGFAYPFFAQTAWSTLLYNITLTQGPNSTAKHWYPLHTDPFNPPAHFADQISDPTSPLYLDPHIPNTIFTLPDGLPQMGIPALASTVGIRPQDAFNNSVALFLLIIAAAIVISLLIFALDWLFGSLSRVNNRSISGSRTPPWSSTIPKEYQEAPGHGLGEDELGGGVRFQDRPASRTLQVIPSSRSGWVAQRLGQSSFHGSVLHGNLVRVLMLFHLPVTIYSCYQFSSGKSHSSLAAVILAAVSFAIISVAIPGYLVLRLTLTPTSKLYDETRTLLALGPLYNHYAHGSQLFACLFFACNIAYGLVIGCGQKSGTVQSIIILVVEVASALTTSVWLPWGRGATMGTVSFFLCVARIITAVLLVILSPVVSVGDAAGGWITYAIFVIQGLVYVSFFLMLISKVFEGLVRLIWHVSFDRSKHTVDTGLIGAIGLVARRKHERTRKSGGGRASRSSRPSRADSDSTTANMIPPPGHVASAASRSRTTVSGPPSVLRPEQLNQPYREDSDDETGYILGAWHYDDDLAIEPFTPSPPASPAPPPAPPAAPSSGFSRIAGGRANIDSPYTMTGTTSTAFAASTSAGQNMPSTSTANLPPGAMAPGHASHARKKSQSAIIEDASTLFGSKGDSSDVADDGPRRKNWLSRALDTAGRTRRRVPSESMLPDESPTSPDASSRTFVVIRDRRPSPLSQAQLPEDVVDASPGPDAEGARSFSVVRPQKTGGGGVAEPSS
ncbi:hypothetical protein M422DRAFT_238126 [Sphaerobolus stellatus SS14]|nr:hypothetical protein M422DRAFT_238126 [Sphaerobolus stellatus SS14]